MCGICARMVVAPVRKTSIPVDPLAPPVAIPVARPAPPVGIPVARPAPGAVPVPIPVAASATPTGPYAIPVTPANAAAAAAGSPTSSLVSSWIARARNSSEATGSDAESKPSSEGGLRSRGVQVAVEEE